VTLVTLIAKVATVYIIPHMADYTGSRLLDMLVHFLFMTGLALQALMGILQLKTRLAVMIEKPEPPAIRVMTFFALST